MEKLMKVLLKKSVTVTPKDEKTNIFLPFTVEDSLKRLEIDYSYSPKELEDEEKSIRLVKENLQRDGYVIQGITRSLCPLRIS